MTRSAESLHLAAVDLANRGKLTAAERALARAASRTDDIDLHARIAGTLALVRVRMGQLDEAEQMCAEALATPGLTDHTRALLSGQMGTIMENAGRLDSAAQLLSAAIAGIGEPVARANLLMNRSTVRMQRGALGDAARDVADAAQAYADAGRPVDEAEARHNLGYIDLLRGDIVSALTEMHAARTVLAGVSGVHAAIGDVDRAEVLRDAGLVRDAETLLGQAATVLGSNRMPRARAEAEFHLARSLLVHDPPAARRAARASARRFQKLGNEPWAARAEGLRVRADLAGDRLLPQGSRSVDPRRVPRPAEVEAAASALDRHGFRSEAAAVRMSYELWRIRHGLASNGTVMRVPPRASVEVRLLAHEMRAERAAARGRDAEARRHAGLGLDALGEWQRDFGSLDLQTSVTMHGAGLIYAGLTAAVRSRRPHIVFDWSERARHLSQQVEPLRPPPDPELADELAELRMLRADDPAWLDSPRAVELRERARQRQWSATGSSAFRERVGLDELRAQLDDETALLTYVHSGLGLSVLVITPDRTRLLDLDAWPSVQRTLPGLRADLDMSASMRGAGIADVIRRSLDSRLAALSAALLDAPLAAAGDVRRLVLTVPGVLGGIPWAMLPGMRGRPFTLATSATRWIGLRGEGSGLPGAAGFVVGPRVARGAEEVAAAATAWTGARALHGAEASVSAVTRLAHEVDVLHVAAHGRHTAENPLFSGFELADGTLFGYDIDLVPEVPRTIVLSSCEVGRSSVRWGEEAIGMTRVWLHAGTRCVIASPVVVADDDACELLGIVHAGLARGDQPAEALAAAAEQTGIVAPFQAHGAGL